MKKTNYLFALIILCLACGSSFAADPKPADTKAATPAAAAAEEPAVKKSNT